MTSLFSYLLTFLAIIFWMFRAVVTVLYQLDREFFFFFINTTYEIALLFATLPCLILVVKRNIVGAAAYFGLYATYFGTALYEYVTAGSFTLDIANGANMIFTVIGVILPMLTFLDILVNKNRNLGSGTKKADWFYKNEDYDRKFDERADRNQYRL